MKRFCHLALTALATLALCAACTDELVLPDDGDRRVVIVYMMAENSLSSAAQADLNEINAATSLIPDSCTMVVYFDNCRTDVKPQIYAFDRQKGRQTVFEYGVDPISTDSAIMEAVLRYIVDDYPAEEYALILWSHASGLLPAKRTLGIDNGRNTSTGSNTNTGTEMEISTLRHVLENLGVQWKYIFYDCCFMQCVEVAYELRGVTDWSIGSPAEIPGTGADYTALMPYFFQRQDYAEALVEQYHALYADNYGVLMSAIRSDGLETLASQTARALRDITDFPTDGVQQYSSYDVGKVEYYDMASLMNRWGACTTTWQDALDAAVPSRLSSPTWLTSSTGFDATLTDADHYAGVSMYVPFEGRDSYNATWRTYEWYTAVGHLFDL